MYKVMLLKFKNVILESETSGFKSQLCAYYLCQLMKPMYLSLSFLYSPGLFFFGDQWDLITELPQDWGNRLL